MLLDEATSLSFVRDSMNTPAIYLSSVLLIDLGGFFWFRAVKNSVAGNSPVCAFWWTREHIWGGTCCVVGFCHLSLFTCNIGNGPTFV